MKPMNNFSVRLVSILVLSIVLAACGGNSSGSSSGNRQERNAPASESQHVAHVNEANASEADAGGANAGEADSTVNVVAKDFAFELESNEASAGVISFVLQNEGAMPHDFAMTVNGQQHKTEMLKPGQSGSLTIELQPGTYEYICTVPGHDILGMKGTFTVK